MSDPPRLKDLPGDAFTRDLLRAAAPTPAMRPADLARLHAPVAKIAATTPAAVTLGAGYGAHALVALALTAGAAGAWRASRPHTAATVRAATQSAPAVQNVPVVQNVPAMQNVPAVQSVPAVQNVPAVEPVPERTAPPLRPHRAPRVTASPAAEVPVPTRPPTLAEELAVLRSARALMARDPAAAAQVLAEADGTFAGGQLRGERAAARVEALLRAGRRDEGAARLRALEASSTDEAQLARLRAMLRGAP
jgi:hypothetical protein